MYVLFHSQSVLIKVEDTFCCCTCCLSPSTQYRTLSCEHNMSLYTVGLALFCLLLNAHSVFAVRKYAKVVTWMLTFLYSFFLFFLLFFSSSFLFFSLSLSLSRSLAIGLSSRTTNTTTNCRPALPCTDIFALGDPPITHNRSRYHRYLPILSFAYFCVPVLPGTYSCPPSSVCD